jgi:hypothetical protein
MSQPPSVTIKTAAGEILVDQIQLHRIDHVPRPGEFVRVASETDGPQLGMRKVINVMTEFVERDRLDKPWQQELQIVVANDKG